MNKKLFLMILTIGCLGFLGANDFVTPKKKKSSANKLKEQRFDEVGKALKLLPQIHKLIAEIEECEVTTICDFFADDKEGFCATANKETLQRDLTSLQTFNQEMEKLKVALQKRKDFLDENVTKA